MSLHIPPAIRPPSVSRAEHWLLSGAGAIALQVGHCLAPGRPAINPRHLTWSPSAPGVTPEHCRVLPSTSQINFRKKCFFIFIQGPLVGNVLAGRTRGGPCPVPTVTSSRAGTRLQPSLCHRARLLAACQGLGVPGIGRDAPETVGTSGREGPPRG